MPIEFIIAIASVIWAFTLLCIQGFIAWGGGKKDFSTKEGSQIAGVIFNFTVAMLPKHKETACNHPVKFLIGITMHVGALYAILRVFILFFFPDKIFMYPEILAAGIILPLLCGIYLLLRRIFNSNLRMLSVFDDYLAVLMTISFIIFTILFEISVVTNSVYLISASVLFFYLPIGKLRHVLFFFLARINYGSRLGYRGIYPTKKHH